MWLLCFALFYFFFNFAIISLRNVVLFYFRCGCHNDATGLSVANHFFFFFIFRFLVKMTILIYVNNGQPIPLMWYLFILLFFRVLALENIAKILPTGPSRVFLQFVIVVFPDHTHLLFLCLFLAVPVGICL